MATDTPHARPDAAVRDTNPVTARRSCLLIFHSVRLPLYAVRAARHAYRIAPRPKATAGFYLVAVLASAVGVDTSRRFFGQVLHVDNKVESGGLSAVLAMALVACVVAIRASGHPGTARALTWALCGLALYMAVEMFGWAEGIARAALGPALVVAALHLALGVEGTGTGRGDRAG